MIKKLTVALLALCMAIGMMAPVSAQAFDASEYAARLGRIFEDAKANAPLTYTEHESGVTSVRSEGKDRFETAINTAYKLKTALGVEKFDVIIVAASHNYPDALSGSCLAAKYDAPILVVRTGNKTGGVEEAVKFIDENLGEGGKVYILGGASAVSADAEEKIKAVAGSVIRLAGSDRYETNMSVLEEAGFEDGSDLIVADAGNFADALSASALGKPILLVNKKTGTLSREQVDFLAGRNFGHIYILGGESAVPELISDELKVMFLGVPVERIADESRYETSVKIAEKFFEKPAAVSLATGSTFSDGLTGGSLAHAVASPLILTRSDSAANQAAVKYVKKVVTDKLIAIGGQAALPVPAVRAIAGVTGGCAHEWKIAYRFEHKDAQYEAVYNLISPAHDMPVLGHKCACNTCGALFDTPQEAYAHADSTGTWYDIYPLPDGSYLLGPVRFGGCNGGWHSEYVVVGYERVPDWGVYFWRLKDGGYDREVPDHAVCSKCHQTADLDFAREVGLDTETINYLTYYGRCETICHGEPGLEMPDRPDYDDRLPD